ncbi:Putative DNA-binding domain-containing protein [Sphingomonas sp. NFR04]|uniref:HvfC/BufC N-terminal domain-containing protein n=1 Tax=Sphingomonas sp. NFR04 TaxID=1566283 RepID=UPI0008EBB4A4|nr:DNA-binding domain-containing protein [Sphingomonas sp. NFR04]SFJ70264.1 Putative DNA-binding domain-containing protein [Sphingomonas sp. NFR04]
MRLATLQQSFGQWLHAESTEAAAQLGGGPGLDVYLNNYRSQLVAALEGSFPQLQRWLGGTAFLAAAAQHIETSPPRAWTLDAYGEDFPATIAALYPNDPECAELARIEWALAATFTTPDIVPLSPDSLGAVDWETVRFAFVPNLAMLPVITNAAALWQSLTAGGPPPAAQRLPAPAAVLLWRDGFNPSFRTIEQAEATAIFQLEAGTPFGALCAACATEHGDADSATMIGTWLGGWLRDGILAAVR